MSVIYRPHRGNLHDAMALKKEFKTFEALQKYIVDEYKPYIKLKPEEVVAGGHPIYDERTGWMDSDYLCIVGYDQITDKEGFEKYFGGRYSNDCCIGIFATNYSNVSEIRR